MKAFLLLLSCSLFVSCQGEREGAAEAADKSGPGAATEPNEESPVVVMETSLGTIKARLHPDTAPITTENFLTYVESGHYDGTIFHRVMPSFMIQGGGFTLKNEVGTEKPTGPMIKNESAQTEKNLRGTLAMARLPKPDTATAQFFINVTDNSNLDYPNAQGHGYAVFGEVIDGMEIVDKIKDVPTGTSYMNSLGEGERLSAGPHQNVPLEPVIIQSIRLAPAD